jgi:hypothetical protein
MPGTRKLRMTWKTDSDGSLVASWHKLPRNSGAARLRRLLGQRPDAFELGGAGERGNKGMPENE